MKTIKFQKDISGRQVADKRFWIAADECGMTLSGSAYFKKLYPRIPRKLKKQIKNNRRNGRSRLT